MGFDRTPQAACSPDHSRRSSGGAQRGLGAVVGPCASTPGERGRTGSLCSGDGASSEFSGKHPRAETLSGSSGSAEPGGRRHQVAPAARREQLPALGCEAWRVVRQAVRAFQEEPGFGLKRHPEQRSTASSLLSRC